MVKVVTVHLADSDKGEPTEVQINEALAGLFIELAYGSRGRGSG
jgi:hypothetical protein